MAEDDLDALVGASCTATLDTAAQTLTFVHRGFGAFHEQKALSPIVVPLGAIATVEFKRGRFLSSFWVTLRDQPPWLHGINRDPHGLTCGVDPTPFAERVRAAAAAAAPLESGTWEPVDPADVPDPVPTWRSKFAKAVGTAAVNGFFNSR